MAILGLRDAVALARMEAGFFLTTLKGSRTMNAVATKPTFYARWLMGRTAFKPQDFGIDMVEHEDFVDMLCEDFNDYVRGTLTLDEMLLHPRTAMHFCDSIRAKHLFHDLPDDIILRAIMARRKNPGG
jgi:hypothetical protein